MALNGITKSSLYICPLCHAITALPYTSAGSRCITCNTEMRELEDDFDLDEIAEEQEKQWA
jgi:hypothetical protein